MLGIHESCVEHGQGTDRVDYIKGANIAAFVKLADAISAYGVM
jgi:glutamate dehydrogenase (NADP+)